jgi:hypothetical protein
VFTLTIKLGNDQMRRPADVAAALDDVARQLRWHHEFADVPQRIRDVNGNTVGAFSTNFDPPEGAAP